MQTEEKRKKGLRITTAGIIFLLVLAALTVSSFVQQSSLLILTTSLLISIMLMSIVLTRKNLNGLAIRRRFPEEVQAGQAFDVEVEAVNSNKRSSWAISVEDCLASNSIKCRPALSFPSVAGGSPARRRYRLSVDARGLYRFGPFVLKTVFPFGFFEQRDERVDFDSMVVLPRLGYLTTQWRRESGIGLDTGLTSNRAAGRHSDEFHGLREFKSGDDPRHIHWKTTARRGVKMLKEFEPYRSLETLVVVEPWLPANATPEMRRSLELMISFAATVCREVSRHPNSRLILAIASTPPIIRHGTCSNELVRECLKRLACIEPSETADLIAASLTLPLADPMSQRSWILSTRSWEGRKDLFLRTLGNRRLGKHSHYINVTAGELSRYFSLEGRNASPIAAPAPA